MIVTLITKLSEDCEEPMRRIARKQSNPPKPSASQSLNLLPPSLLITQLPNLFPNQGHGKSRQSFMALYRHRKIRSRYATAVPLKWAGPPRLGWSSCDSAPFRVPLFSLRFLSRLLSRCVNHLIDCVVIRDTMGR